MDIISGIFSKAVLFSLTILLIGCNFSSPFVGNAAAEEPPNLSAWLAYWDLSSGSDELDKISGRLQQLSYFAAYFDKADQLFVPKELLDKRSLLQQKKVTYKTYLSFVNDKQHADGTVSMKDTDVLRRIFTNESLTQKHMDEIIALTKQGGYDGIEIDYERVWKDEKVGQAFLQFCNKLYMQALINDLKLRVVLEPSTPFAAVSFPYGPEYIVMLYNLYGLHSGPGPKANPDFIKKTIQRMGVVPGKKAVALATGGCIWGDNGEKRFITETEAEKLATTYQSEIKRDPDSQCAVYSYTAAGVSYQVWYADAKTLAYWITIAKKHGQNNIHLWRLGGNSDITRLQQFIFD